MRPRAAAGGEIRTGRAWGRAVPSPDLMAGSVFGTTLLAALEWLVFDPDRSQADIVDAILATYSGRLVPPGRLTSP